MKKTILIKAISTALVLVMLLNSIQLVAVTAFAAEATNNETTSTAKELTLFESIEKEMEERSTITKDRSAIKAQSQAAVYVDGKLYKEGDFSPMWNVAMELAAYVDTSGINGGNLGRYTTVEYVLNRDFNYDSSWFGEGTMTVSNRYFTIDLNGHVLRRWGDNGSVISVIKGSVLTIMDSDPTRENGGYIGSYNTWHPLQGGSFKIKGGVICGGYLKTDDGGGLYVNDKSVVHLIGGTIAGNKADVGSGVYLDGGSTLDMSRGKSQICYNYSAGTLSDGGAIFLRSDCTVIGGYVHHNLADDYGGGIRAKGGNITISDVVIYDNEAMEYGGGLYIERSYKEQIVTVSGCKIVNNYAPDGGGGVYLWDLYRTNMVSCLVEENRSAKNGAGICVSCFMGTDLAVSGEMIVRNNYEVVSDNKLVNSNLYLSGDDDLIVDSLSLGAEIWIKTGTAASDYNGVKCTLLDSPTNTSHLFFFSDVDGFYVKYQDDPAKAKYRHLYLEKGTRVEDGIKALKDYATKELSTSYNVESGENKGESFPLYKGYAEFGLMSTSDFISASPFYYSDGYFFENPEVYNPHLATMSMNLTVSAFGRYTDLVGDNAYANHFANVKQLLSDIGCADSNFYVNKDYQMKPAYFGEEGRLSTIGVAISQKPIELNGETYTLVPIAIRGAGYESEWSSNVSIGKTGEAKGFADAADQVYNQVQYYIENYGLTEELASGRIKFWVVGYSRAGATANLTSKRLVDNYGDEGNVVYGYTFEAPMGGVASAALDDVFYTGYGTYPTIHNIINEADFVTLVAPSEMGFMRYGVDHLIGSDRKGGDPVSHNANSKYYGQRMKMIAQLNAINPYFKFDDSWEVADVNIILGNLPIFSTDMIDKGDQIWDDPNPECRDIATFLPWFFKMVVGDGFMLPSQTVVDPEDPNKTITVFDTTTAREKYSELKPLASIAGNDKSADGTDRPYCNLGYSNMSVEEAAASLVSIFMGELTDDQMNDLMGAIMTNAGILKDDHTTVHKWDTSLFETLTEVTGFGGAPINAVVSVFAPIIKDVSHILDLYDELINDWDERSELEKAQSINWLMHSLLDGKTYNNKSVWDILTEEQGEALANALPVVIWFALNYASRDYNDTEYDDGMWGVGTFVNNASYIISNHYQEVSMAWVRSYDRYYTNDLQAYVIDPGTVTQRDVEGSYIAASGTLTLSGQDGASIFYSVDGGESWSWYNGPVSIDKSLKNVLSFSICRGAKSDVVEISMNPWSGSLLGNGNVWFLIIGAALIVGVSIVVIETNRKKKKQH